MCRIIRLDEVIAEVDVAAAKRDFANLKVERWLSRCRGRCGAGRWRGRGLPCIAAGGWRFVVSARCVLARRQSLQIKAAFRGDHQTRIKICQSDFPDRDFERL